MWRPPYTQYRSVDIEMTAYALLVHTINEDVDGAVPIAKWIVAQRNPNGGFSSTQVLLCFCLKCYDAVGGAAGRASGL